jgi:Zn-dependent alcohol dehydrogenase
VQDFPVEPACQNGEGGVLCSSTGFDTLINATLEYQGAAEACDLRLKSCTSSLLATQELLKIRPPPPSKVQAIGGAAMAAIGAATIAAAVATTQLDDTARIGLGAVGAGVMAAGFIIVIR